MDIGQEGLMTIKIDLEYNDIGGYQEQAPRMYSSLIAYDAGISQSYDCHTIC